MVIPASMSLSDRCPARHFHLLLSVFQESVDLDTDLPSNAVLAKLVLDDVLRFGGGYRESVLGLSVCMYR